MIIGAGAAAEVLLGPSAADSAAELGEMMYEQPAVAPASRAVRARLVHLMVRVVRPLAGLLHLLGAGTSDVALKRPTG
jgi:hypothetical protein